MMELEAFQPQLIPGRLIPHGERLEFRSTDSRVGVLLPIECSDLLILCDGSLSISEIVRTIQKKNGTVHIQTLFRTLYELGRRKALVTPPPWSQEILDLLGASSAWPLTIAHFRFRRTVSAKATPLSQWIFYVLSFTLLGSAVLGVLSLNFEPSDWRFLRADGSFFLGIVMMIVLSTVTLWFSESVRVLLTGLLGGRLQELQLRFNGLTIYPQSSLSSGMATPTSQKFLLHISILLSSLSLMSLSLVLWPTFDSISQQICLLGILLTYVLSDPFRISEATRWLTEFLPTDESHQIEFRTHDQPLLRTLQTFPQLLKSKTLKTHLTFTSIWTISLLLLIYALITSNYRLFEYSLLSEPWREKISSILIFGGLIFFAVRVLNDALEVLGTLWNLIVKPWWIHRSEPKKENKSPIEIVEALSRIPFFDAFNRDELSSFAPFVSWTKPKPNSAIVCIGDPAQDLIFLLSGRVRTSRRFSTSLETIRSEVPAPVLLSSSAITGDSIERQDISAIGEIEILRVNRDQFFRVLSAIGKENALEQLLEDLFIQHYFQLAPLMRNLGPESIKALVERSMRLDYTTGETIFFEGTYADGFFLILRGNVVVSIEGHPVAEIQRGGFFGEISVIADIPRTGTVTAMEQTKVLKVESDLFWQILSLNLTTGLHIEQIAEIRLREDVHIAETLEFRPAK